MAKREILLLGHENLYKISRSITEDQLKKAKKIINDLHDTIVAFKETIPRVSMSDTPICCGR